MVLTTSELTASLQNEVHILLHLAGKVHRDRIDFRPTPKQRSTLELLQYLTVMGPALIEAAQAGTFDVASWTARENHAKALDFDATVAALAAQHDEYARLLGGMTDADMRAEIAMFGPPTSKGAFIVNWVLCGCAAYRTQLFNYLKASGREELDTTNLWGGMDNPKAGA